MTFENFIQSLDSALDLSLPGRDVQFKMAPETRVNNHAETAGAPSARESSVLILLYPDANSVKTVLILRNEYDGVHSGQVSFPGGRYEKHDNSLIYTALREAHEEIAIKPEDVHVIGKLSKLYIPPSNFIVLPVVGYSFNKPLFECDKKEVQKVIEINIFDLLDEQYRKTKTIHIRGKSIVAPVYEIEGVTIWGATAMIISEFLAILAGVFKIARDR